MYKYFQSKINNEVYGYDQDDSIQKNMIDKAITDPNMTNVTDTWPAKELPLKTN